MYVHTHVKLGFPGLQLHGGWKGTGGSQFFRYHDGRFYNGLIVVAFELYETTPNGGGFCCIPGTHKSNVQMPNEWRSFANGVHPVVTEVPAGAGDAIIFTEVLMRGTLPWRVDSPRKTIFLTLSPHGTSWSADYYRPEDFVQYPDMDERKLAILEPPNARYDGRKMFRSSQDPQTLPSKSSGSVACTHLELRRPFSAGTQNDSHHLHIRQIEVFDKTGHKLALQVSCASNMVAKGAGPSSGPSAMIDGDLKGLSHSAFVGESYGSEDHWIQYRLHSDAAVGHVLIHNRCHSYRYRLHGAALALQALASADDGAAASVRNLQEVSIIDTGSDVLTFSVNEAGRLVQAPDVRAVDSS